MLEMSLEYPARLGAFGSLSRHLLLSRSQHKGSVEMPERRVVGKTCRLGDRNSCHIRQRAWIQSGLASLVDSSNSPRANHFAVT